MAAEEWADEFDDDAKAEPELEFTLGTELEVGPEPEFDSEPESNIESEPNSEMEERFSSPDMTSDYLQTYYKSTTVWKNQQNYTNE